MKLKANELRIGNLLQDGVSKALIKVIELTETDIATFVLDRSKFPLQKGWFLEPVPITEGVLKMFGFKMSKTDSVYFLSIPKLNIEIQISEYGCELIGGFGKIELNKMEYAHQLQNLFFVLTNKELTAD